MYGKIMLNLFEETGRIGDEISHVHHRGVGSSGNIPAVAENPEL